MPNFGQGDVLKISGSGIKYTLNMVLPDSTPVAPRNLIHNLPLSLSSSPSLFFLPRSLYISLHADPRMKFRLNKNMLRYNRFHVNQSDLQYNIFGYASIPIIHTLLRDQIY